MDKPSKEKDNSSATPKVSLQPFLPEFGVTAGCNSLGGGSISTTSALGPRVNGLPTLQAPLSRASVLIFTPMHRCLGIFPEDLRFGTDLSLGRWGPEAPKKDGYKWTWSDTFLENGNKNACPIRILAHRN